MKGGGYGCFTNGTMIRCVHVGTCFWNRLRKKKKGWVFSYGKYMFQCSYQNSDNGRSGLRMSKVVGLDFEQMQHCLLTPNPSTVTKCLYFSMNFSLTLKSPSLQVGFVSVTLAETA